MNAPRVRKNVVNAAMRAARSVQQDGFSEQDLSTLKRQTKKPSKGKRGKHASASTSTTTTIPDFPAELDGASRSNTLFVTATQKKKKWAESLLELDPETNSVQMRGQLSDGIVVITESAGTADAVGFVLDLIELQHPFVLVWAMDQCIWCRRFLGKEEWNPEETVFALRDALSQQLDSPWKHMPVVVMSRPDLEEGKYKDLGKEMSKSLVDNTNPDRVQYVVGDVKDKKGRVVPARMLLSSWYRTDNQGYVPYITLFSGTAWHPYDGDRPRNAEYFVPFVRDVVQHAAAASSNDTNKKQKRTTKKTRIDKPPKPIEKEEEDAKNKPRKKRVRRSDVADDTVNATSDVEIDEDAPKRLDDEKKAKSSSKGSSGRKLMDTTLFFKPENCNAEFLHSLPEHELRRISAYCTPMYALAQLATATHPNAVKVALSLQAF